MKTIAQLIDAVELQLADTSNLIWNATCPECGAQGDKQLTILDIRLENIRPVYERY